MSVQRTSGGAIQITPGQLIKLVGGEDTGTGACCVLGDCSIGTRAECDDAGGFYLGNDSICVPNPCIGLTFILSAHNTGTANCIAGPSTVPADGTTIFSDHIYLTHYIGLGGAIDTGGAYFLMFLSRSNGDGPAGHWMLSGAAGCIGHYISPWMDLGPDDPRGTYVFSGHNTGEPWDDPGSNYSGTLVIL